MLCSVVQCNGIQSSARREQGEVRRVHNVHSHYTLQFTGYSGQYTVYSIYLTAYSEMCTMQCVHIAVFIAL